MEFIIYGAGGNGKKICDALLLSGHHIHYFIDLYSNEKSYRGIEILKPLQATERKYTVLVSLSCLSNDIKQQLLADGYHECLNLNEILTTFSVIFTEFFPEQELEKLRQSVITDHDKLSWLESKLADDRSRHTLQIIRNFRTNPTPANYVNNDWLLQYFPEELMHNGLLKSPLRMIDCGAYNGDTWLRAQKVTETYGIDFDTVVCFEPDPINFQALLGSLKHLKQNRTKVLTIQAGVWSCNDHLSFSSCADKTKKVTETELKLNSVIVPVFSIDQICFGTAPNFIKMDIEGAEINAIEGASTTISNFKPALALSVYHELDHIWKIAEQILQLNPDYNLYLYTHGDFCNEIILYAIP